MKPAITLLQSAERRIKRAERALKSAKLRNPVGALRECKNALARVGALRDELANEKRALAKELLAVLIGIAANTGADVPIMFGDQEFLVNRYNMSTTPPGKSRDVKIIDDGIARYFDEPNDFWEFCTTCIEIVEQQLTAALGDGTVRKEIVSFGELARRLNRVVVPPDNPAPDH